LRRMDATLDIMRRIMMLEVHELRSIISLEQVPSFYFITS
jgi:hypothetical protein